MIDLGQSTSPATAAKDVTIETFEQEVMLASREVPIIVDFWATWCGPCKTLGPMLEKAVAARNGAMRMVKVDIDQNQMLAQQLRIQSVPTVYAFVGGQPVDGFQGAVPESEITTFLDRVEGIAKQAGLGGSAPGGPDIPAALKAAQEAFDQNDLSTAAGLYSQLAQMLQGEQNEQLAEALAGLARCHLAGGNEAEARQMLEMVPEAHHALPAVERVQASLDLSAGANDDLAPLKAAAEAAPQDLQAQYDYGSALIGAGQQEEGADILLSIIAKNRDWNEEAARKKLVTLFEALGPTHPTTLSIRRKLSSILFS